jgi:hypothetical protein
MNIGANHPWFKRLLPLGIGFALILPFLGQTMRATAFPAATVSLTMSNPTCAQARPASGACSLEMRYVVASGSDQSFSRVEVLVDGKLRVYMAGFFESTAYLTNLMIPGGLSVPCGSPNESGLPNFGRAYVITANAYMADGTSATNSMNVFCPAYDGKFYLPIVQK